MEIGVPSVCPFEDAGENLTFVGFVAFRHQAALAGTAAIQFVLNIGLDDWHARRATIDHHPDAAPVGFAPGRNPEKLAETVAHQIAASAVRRSSFRSSRSSTPTDNLTSESVMPNDWRVSGGIEP